MTDYETHPGAGGKGTAGYWGYSDADKPNGRGEAEFEQRYKQLIPKNTYITRVHDATSCKICSSPNAIVHCPKFGLSFEPLPTETIVIGSRKLVRCVYCQKTFWNKPVGKQKSLNRRNRTIGDK